MLNTLLMICVSIYVCPAQCAWANVSFLQYTHIICTSHILCLYKTLYYTHKIYINILIILGLLFCLYILNVVSKSLLAVYSLLVFSSKHQPQLLSSSEPPINNNNHHCETMAFVVAAAILLRSLHRLRQTVDESPIYSTVQKSSQTNIGSTLSCDTHHMLDLLTSSCCLYILKNLIDFWYKHDSNLSLHKKNFTSWVN